MAYTRLNPKDNLTDSGWLYLKNSGNVTTGRYRKLGGVVYLDVSLGGWEQIMVNSSGVNLGTLPAGYRPSDTAVVSATLMTNGSGQLSVGTDGAVTAYNFATASWYFAAFIAFPVG